MKPAHILALIAPIFLASPAFAAKDWTLVPAESTLSFTAVQNGAPTQGGFGAFGGTIAFDPNDLAGSKIDIDVDMTKISSPADNVASELVTDTWFSSAAFPKAHYVSTAIKKATSGGYDVEGTLTLRGVSAPVALNFDFTQFGPKTGVPGTLRAVAKGKATLSRTKFGVGQGEWASTDMVKDPVALDFTITAERPAP